MMVKIGQVGSRWLKTGRDRSRLIDPRSSAALRRRRRECYKKRRCYYWILLDTRRYRVLRAMDAGPDPPSPGSDSEDSSGAGRGKIMVRIGSVECGSGRLGLERFGRRRGDLAPGFQVHSVGGEFSRDVVTRCILSGVYADFIVVTEVVTGYV